MCHVQTLAKINNSAENEKVVVVISGVDCDRMHTTEPHTMDADLLVVEDFMATTLANAEGPTSMWIMRPSDAAIEFANGPEWEDLNATDARY